jgi:hypothetical protein
MQSQPVGLYDYQILQQIRRETHPIRHIRRRYGRKASTASFRCLRTINCCKGYSDLKTHTEDAYGEYLVILLRDVWSRNEGLDLDFAGRGQGTLSSLGELEGEERDDEGVG